MKAFDLIATPIERGFTLIEASAGTGKTTTITALVLRLIVEENKSIEKILVTTYTELATAELRRKIREILRAALNTTRGEKVAEIPAEIIQRAPDRKEAARRLEAALRSFDDAPVFTIHGFCARVLADRAFEAGTMFQTELITDPSEILREVAEDFWRTHFYEAPALMTALARGGKLSVSELLKLLQEMTTNPTLQIVPDATALADLETQIASEWRSLSECWGKSRTQVTKIFDDLRWGMRSHGKRDVVDARLQALAKSIEQSRASAELLPCLEFFSTAKIQANTRAAARSPRHQFFDCCEKLAGFARQFNVAIKAHFCRWAREELQKRKAERQVQSFDDLLTQLDAALRGRPGDGLKKSLRERFEVALIDEFQDTDPVQYSIFSQIYDGTNAPVFFIGDPKQAIYGFRGADVFTYLKAAKSAARKYSLPKNWRSEKKLVQAVNEVFTERGKKSFVIDGINFQPVTAADEGVNAENPLRIWLAQEPKKIPLALASEIARLVAADVLPAEIAVLVYANWQPAEIQKALARYRIPSVVYSAENVFKSREADELHRILRAVAEPTHERRLRAALATDALGLNANQLDQLNRDEAEWESRLNRFADYHLAWQERGFVQMTGKLLVGEKVRSRLLSYADGERRLNNLLHLIELLHRACAENRFGIDGLLRWLRRQISADVQTREEYELRLESDDDAVTIVTVHKSKGLEYPITFLPHAWRRGKNRELVKFHEGDGFYLDLEKQKENQRRQHEEELSESVRQFYVALTRAKTRGYFIWAGEGQTSKTAPAWLFSSKGENAFLSGGESVATTGANLRARFGSAVEEMPLTPAENYRGDEKQGATLRPRIFTGAIDRRWGISSFTSLISGRAEEIEWPDYDAVETAIEDVEEPQGIHAFPRGTRAGTCLHLVLEELDFAKLSKPLVTEKLRDFHIEGFEDVVFETLGKLVQVPLGEDGFSLSQIPPRSRLSEMEFTFPITALTMARLRKVFRVRELPLEIERLQFAPANGFMKGFIDLVFARDGRFYLLDWKSNWLGSDLRSYAPENIEAEMARHFYPLQLCIYAVALHRYLQRRLPDYDFDRNFGGGFYVFLRGVDPTNPKSGLFSARPSRALIEKLDRLFHGNE
jgi:exodeoxyribonuclease V beta subunit